jgi:hypothetical protein
MQQPPFNCHTRCYEYLYNTVTMNSSAHSTCGHDVTHSNTSLKIIFIYASCSPTQHKETTSSVSLYPFVFMTCNHHRGNIYSRNWSPYFKAVRFRPNTFCVCEKIKALMGMLHRLVSVCRVHILFLMRSRFTITLNKWQNSIQIRVCFEDSASVRRSYWVMGRPYLTGRASVSVLEQK